MSNQYVFNDRLPLAPLKIAALESCRDLAQKVNDHIVNFRRNDAEELLRRQVGYYERQPYSNQAQTV